MPFYVKIHVKIANREDPDQTASENNSLYLELYTEQKWKRYNPIIYILWESNGQKVFTKA